jgi:hypothetical protein
VSVDSASADTMVRRWLDRTSAHVWTTLGQSVLLAHLVADQQLTEHVAAFLAELEPFADRIAVIGQVAVVGPVAFAIARLHAVAGDLESALAYNTAAREHAERTGGLPSVLRCRLLDCRLRGGDRDTELADLEHQASSIGMKGLVREIQQVSAGH